jgi:hypothetical protein
MNVMTIFMRTFFDRTYVCSLFMPYWLSLCVLRRTCGQGSLYETLSHIIIIPSKHHYHHHFSLIYAMPLKL